MKKKIFFLSLILLLLIIPLKSVLADGLVPCGLNGAADCTLCHLVLGIKNIFDFLLKLLLAACLLGITIAGVLYMVSAGSKGLIEKAKKAFTYSITALVLLLCSWLIVNAVLNALGFKQVGSWSSFTCDTTQTIPPTGTGTGTGTGAGTGTGTGGKITPMPTDGSKISNALQKYAGVVYGQNGYDCSKYIQSLCIESMGWDPGRTTLDHQKNAIPFDQSQLVNGTILTSSNGHGGRHDAFYYDGNIYHLGNTGQNPKVWNTSNYLQWASNNGNFTMRLPGT